MKKQQRPPLWRVPRRDLGCVNLAAQRVAAELWRLDARTLFDKAPFTFRALVKVAELLWQSGDEPATLAARIVREMPPSVRALSPYVRASDAGWADLMATVRCRSDQTRPRQVPPLAVESVKRSANAA